MKNVNPIHPVRTGSFLSNLNAVFYVFKNRLTTYSRYRGQVLMSIITPIMVAALPILMGTAISGDPNRAAEIFQSNTGTSAGAYQGYMLIGALLFQMVSNSLWNFGFWLRREQTTGTLESGVYLVPVGKPYLILGSSLYVVARNSVSFIIALFLGVIIFSLQISNFLETTIWLGILFLLIGFFPIIGLALLFGAVVLKFKEVGTLINLMTWVVSLLMGVFFPITILPIFFRFFALIFPPTWTANGIRAALYEAPYFFDLWSDLLVSIGFALIVPFIALIWFSRVERNILKNDGIGKY